MNAELSGNYSMPKLPWHKRVKNSLKEREIQKTVVSFWHNHKEAIIIGGLCLATGTVIAKRSASISSTASTTIDGDGNTCTYMTAEQITNVTHNHTSKPLGYIVTDGERWWETQAAAAQALGETERNVSRHINHGQPLRADVNLTRVGVRS